MSARSRSSHCCGAACTGHREARPYWRDHAPADAVIFVVDSCDTEQLGTSEDELLRLMVADAFWGLPLIVAFNKQDLPRAQTATHITQEWFKPALLSGIASSWSTQVTCAPTGDGLYEMLEEILCATLHAAHAPAVFNRMRPFPCSVGNHWETKHRYFPALLRRRIKASIAALVAEGSVCSALFEHLGAQLAIHFVADCDSVHGWLRQRADGTNHRNEQLTLEPGPILSRQA